MEARRQWRILFVTLVLISCRPSLAEDPAGIVWLDDYGAARRKGIEDDRPVLLYITTDGCHYCTKMQTMTFSDSENVEDLQQQFVPAKLQLAADSDLGKQLMITIYPTTIIISPQGRILDYVRGYVDPVSLQRRMTDAIGSQNVLASRE